MTLSTGPIWRPVVGYEGLYEVSSWGSVRSLDRPSRNGQGPTVKRGLILKMPINHANGGYREVGLYSTQGDSRTWKVHQLVCAAFRGSCPPGQECRHLDGDSLNCCSTNLAWGTRSENRRDTVDHGRDHNASKKICKRGHPLSSNNVRIENSGSRRCLPCERDRDRERIR